MCCRLKGNPWFDILHQWLERATNGGNTKNQQQLQVKEGAKPREFGEGIAKPKKLGADQNIIEICVVFVLQIKANICQILTLTNLLKHLKPRNITLIPLTLKYLNHISHLF